MSDGYRRVVRALRLEAEARSAGRARPRRVYTPEFAALLASKFPASMTEALERCGWNWPGVREACKEAEAEARRRGIGILQRSGAEPRPAGDATAADGGGEKGEP